MEASPDKRVRAGSGDHTQPRARVTTQGTGSHQSNISSGPANPAIPRAARRARRITEILLREILDRKIEVRTGSTVRKISVREAMLTRFAESALKGDPKSAAFLLQRYDMPETAEDHGDSATTPQEQEIIDAYLKGYLEKGGKKK
jgi:Family of unknown function (DUF5681)